MLKSTHEALSVLLKVILPPPQKKNRFEIRHCESQILIANASMSSKITRYILTGLELNQANYTNTDFFVMSNLYCDVVTGHDLLEKHSRIRVP